MSNPGFSGNKYLVDINGSGGAFTPILLKSPARKVVIQESQITSTGAANTPQGAIQYRIPNDDTTSGFTTVFVAVQGINLPISIPDNVENYKSVGALLGNGPNLIIGQNTILGAQTGNPATHLMDVRSGSATATTVEITEYN